MIRNSHSAPVEEAKKTIWSLFRRWETILTLFIGFCGSLVASYLFGKPDDNNLSRLLDGGKTIAAYLASPYILVPCCLLVVVILGFLLFRTRRVSALHEAAAQDYKEKYQEVIQALPFDLDDVAIFTDKEGTVEFGKLKINEAMPTTEILVVTDDLINDLNSGQFDHAIKLHIKIWFDQWKKWYKKTYYYMGDCAKCPDRKDDSCSDSKNCDRPDVSPYRYIITSGRKGKQSIRRYISIYFNCHIEAYFEDLHKEHFEKHKHDSELAAMKHGREEMEERIRKELFLELEEELFIVFGPKPERTFHVINDRGGQNALVSFQYRTPGDTENPCVIQYTDPELCEDYRTAFNTLWESRYGLRDKGVGTFSHLRREAVPSLLETRATEIWVLSPDLRIDLEQRDFFSTIYNNLRLLAANIKKGKEHPRPVYKYIIPDTNSKELIQGYSDKFELNNDGDLRRLPELLFRSVPIDKLMQFSVYAEMTLYSLPEGKEYLIMFFGEETGFENEVLVASEGAKNRFKNAFEAVWNLQPSSRNPLDSEDSETQ